MNDGGLLSHTQWTTIGDVGNTLLFLSSVSYAFAVVMATNNDDGGGGIFSPEWLRDGFCVTHVNESTTSHEIACVLDVCLGVFLLILYWMYGRFVAEMGYANKYTFLFALALLGHGLAHGYIGYRLQSSSMEKLIETARSSPHAYSVATFVWEEIPLALFFWYPLLQATMPDTSWIFVSIISLMVKLTQNYVPLRFMFGFVQTVAVSAFALDQTFQPISKKGFLYASLVWLPGIIPSAIAWLESTHCGMVRDHFYGHVMYDASLAISFIVWYGLAYVSTTSIARLDPIRSKTKRKHT